MLEGCFPRKADIMDDNIEESIKYARETVGGDPLARHLGIVIEEVSEGFARVSLEAKPEYMNAVGRAHGAAVYAVIDQSLAVAANSRGVRAVTLDVNARYHSGAPGGDVLVAEASPIEIKKRISVWKVEVRARSAGSLVATAVATAYHQA